MQVALGIEHGPAVSTRGWIRLDPGECKKALEGAVDADTVYLHARNPPVYAPPHCPSMAKWNFAYAKLISRSRTRVSAQWRSRRASPRQSRQNPQAVWSSIWLRKPITPTLRPASRVSSVCSPLPDRTQLRSTASTAPKLKPRSRVSRTTAAQRRNRRAVGLLRCADQRRAAPRRVQDLAGAMRPPIPLWLRSVSSKWAAL